MHRQQHQQQQHEQQVSSDHHNHQQPMIPSVLTNISHTLISHDQINPADNVDTATVYPSDPNADHTQEKNNPHVLDFAANHISSVNMALNAVMAPSQPMPTSSVQVQGYDFNQGVNYKKLMESMYTSGFQATAVGQAINEINRMVKSI